MSMLRNTSEFIVERVDGGPVNRMKARLWVKVRSKPVAGGERLLALARAGAS
jgi:hypothetical protein